MRRAAAQWNMTEAAAFGRDGADRQDKVRGIVGLERHRCAV